MRSMPLGEVVHYGPQVCPGMALGLLSSFIAVGDVLPAQAPLHHSVLLRLCLGSFPFLPQGFPKAGWGTGR